MAAGTSQESRLAIVIDTANAQRRIEELRRQLRELGGAADDTTNNSDRLNNANGRLADSSSRLSKAMGLAAKAAKYGAAAIGGLAVAAIKVSGDFEEAMNAVRSVSGATGKDFDDLRNLAKKMGAETAFSATEAANGMEYLAMAGMNTQQVLATIPNALSLAAAGSIDLAQSADILSNIMSGMGIAAEESARVADVLAATAAGANTDISALGEAMKYVAPIAKTMGYSLEETSAAVGILGNAGIAAGQAGTSLRAIMTRIAADKGAKETLADLGVTAVDSQGKMRSLTEILSDLQVATKDLSSEQQIEIFKDIAGAEAMGGLAVLVDGMANDTLPQLIDKLEGAEGAAEKMAAIRMEGLNGAIKTAKSAAEGFLIALGDAGLLDLAARGVSMLAGGISQLSAILPQVTADVTAFFQKAEVATAMEMAIEGLKGAWDNLVSVVRAAGDVVAPVIDWFREHNKLSEALIISIGLVAGAFVVYNAAVAIGAAVTGGFVAVLALLTSPILLTVAALVALTAAAVYVYQNWEDLIAIINEFSDDVVNYVVGAFNNAIDAANNFADTIVNSVVSGFKSVIQSANDFADKIVNSITNGFKSAVKAIVDAWNNAKTATVNKFNEISTSIVTILREIPAKVMQIGKDIIGGLIDGVKAKWSSLKSTVGDVATSVVDVFRSRDKGFDTHSPSKKTHKIGEDVAQGLADGIKSKKKTVITEAQKMAADAVKAIKSGITGLEKELALFGDKSRLADFNYDVRGGKYKGANDQDINRYRMLLVQLMQLEDANKKLEEAEQSRLNVLRATAGYDRAIYDLQASYNTELRSLMYELESDNGKFKDIADDVKATMIEAASALDEQRTMANYRDTLNDIARQMALLSDNSLYAQWAYDLTDASNILSTMDETLKGDLLGKIKGLEDAKNRLKAGDALSGIMGEIQEESPLGKIEADYERRLAKVEEYEKTHTDMLENAKIARLAIEQSYMDAKRDLMLTQGEALFGNLAGLSKAFLGEQSSLYKGLFAIEKAYTLATVLLKNKEAISKAWASAAFPYNLPAVASAVAGTAGLASAVQGIMPQGFKKGGYTGNMGASQVAGVVHGQEYVFDAQATKRIGVDNLNAMRSGKSVGGGDVNINVNVDAKGNAQVSGDNERMGRDMANGIKAVVLDVIRKEKRQGGML